jgi:catechol 2,3-dioxygenase-like lactoylglutathione lyase family enzyme
MSRLSIVVLFTPELARQREFYEQSLGLTAASSSSRWVQFGTSDAVLALRELGTGEPPRIELGFDVPSLDEYLALLETRGVQPEGKFEVSPDCRIARVLDPEGNVLQLVERKTPTQVGRWPRLSHAIVNAQAFEACARFYHDALGFKMAEEREHWIEFETGAARLTLHASRDADGLPLLPDQRVAFALMDEDLDKWADELRERGLRFVTTPTDEEIGRMAEVEDKDGWFVVLRGPEPEVPFEDALASDYADDDSARIEQIRKTGEGEAAGRPGFGSRKLAKKRPERVITRGFEAMERAPREPERGSFSPGGGASRGDGPSRPFTPRPDGPSRPFTPRPDGPSRPFTPRPDGPSRPFTPRPDRPPGASSPRPFSPRPDGPSRPFTPRPDRPPGASGPRPFAPRPDGAPRPTTPRPDRPSGPSASRPFTPRPDASRTGPPRPSSPRPDTPRTAPPSRDAGSGPSAPRPDGPPRGPRRDED